jgi:hypothetical protein
MLYQNSTYGLVNAAGAAAGTQTVTNSVNGFRHLFLVTLSAAANVWAEAAVTPVAPGVARWVPVSGTITISDCIAVEGNFELLRIRWTGNTGTVTVDLVQSALQPKIY